VHPSIFDEVMAALEEAARGAAGSSKEQIPLQVKDVRDKLESFEIMGPLAGKVLRRVLRVTVSESPEKKQAFTALLSGDAAESPSDAVVAVNVYDPRLS